MSLLRLAARALPYFLLVLLNLVALLISAVALDGCSKCPIDSNQERWSFGYSAFWVLLVPALFLLFWIGLKAYYCRRERKLLATLLILAVAGIFFYFGIWLELLGIALKCGEDCLPADPLSSTFLAISDYLTIPGLLGLGSGFIWFKWTQRTLRDR
ncbi:hypothetical protein [Roseibium salinum]|uniref:Disulfide bond formation protein DsbB n=1 Tax=Roseibium salinum TaxID=1604349 RepID=A0ABT3R918_9HYPH|nr:hypothetical protein [Roseibium sp. DSM 29163]MCX2725557.1 hypothetical protein [Roseibium sp. DSM 29163]